jgi:hypothetical protein
VRLGLLTVSVGILVRFGLLTVSVGIVLATGVTTPEDGFEHPTLLPMHSSVCGISCVIIDSWSAAIAS